MMNAPDEKNSRWEMLLFDYVEGNLSAEEAAAVERMIASSPLIQAEVAAWKRAKMPPPPPVEYPHIESLKKEERSGGRWAWWRVAALWFIGALVGMIGMHGWHTLRAPSRPEAVAGRSKSMEMPPTGKVIPSSPTAFSDQLEPSSHRPRQKEAAPAGDGHLSSGAGQRGGRALASHRPLRRAAVRPHASPQPLEKLPTRPIAALPEAGRKHAPMPVFAYFRVQPPVPTRRKGTYCPPQLVVVERSRGVYQGYDVSFQVACREVRVAAEVMKPRYWLPYAMTRVNRMVVNSLFASSN